MKNIWVLGLIFCQIGSSTGQTKTIALGMLGGGLVGAVAGYEFVHHGEHKEYETRNTIYGPEEYQGENLIVLCSTAAHASQSLVALQKLTDINSGCNPQSTPSGACTSAIDQYCTSNGFVGGGFGPVEQSTDTAAVICQSSGARVVTTFTELQTFVLICTADSPGSGSCNSAVHRDCQARGHISGYGILEYSGNNVWIGCAD